MDEDIGKRGRPVTPRSPGVGTSHLSCGVEVRFSKAFEWRSAMVSFIANDRLESTIEKIEGNV